MSEKLLPRSGRHSWTKVWIVETPLLSHIAHDHIEFDIMRNALWTDPDDQSLWFYHQFLMFSLLNPSMSFVPHFTTSQREDYARSQIEELEEMLDGAEECKWIYNGLLEYTLAICGLLEREPNEEEKESLRTWLEKLKKLDPTRSGRCQAREAILRL